ncbi:methionine ABC transporter ATP-binding protein [Leptotrichia sp. oral taxon 212]|uniref:methionine ABC transporter ATP-binding protein n=1 Tax=Leptotrichia sp. oral taxon 212 TaxID=712357 RepID=UPI0006AA00F5|nr:ATP-binding cassette domain-containing protein [Leptotrichia sp. oral taxon 212]ALA95358.1 methionine ABC transporter ATP-binding protein [Leptotrichia sp. oral taxon 212]
MIEILNVEKVFKNKKSEVHALRNVSLKVEKGDIFGIVGYSGAGKSTLLRLVNLLEKPTSGSVKIEEREIINLSEKELNILRKNIGMVFQQFNLLESQTVYQNLKIPLIISETPKNSIDKRIEELLDFVGLKDKKNSSVSKLSGGQKQRIGIARALATHPKILLCDEATSALDPKTTKSILQLLKKINNEFGITILLITHEMEVVKEICNKVAVMQDGEIKEQGNIIEIFTNPQENITKNFISSIINNNIPESLKEELDLNLPVVKLTFLGEKSGQPLISEINKKFDISTKILSASVNELSNTILGVLVVQLEGNPAIINEVEEFIKNRGVKIERMEII